MFGYNATDADFQMYMDAMDRFEDYVNEHTSNLNNTFSKHKTAVKEVAA